MLAYQHNIQYVSAETKKLISASHTRIHLCTQQYWLACGTATQIKYSDGLGVKLNPE